MFVSSSESSLSPVHVQVRAFRVAVVLWFLSMSTTMRKCEALLPPSSSHTPKHPTSLISTSKNALPVYIPSTTSLAAPLVSATTRTSAALFMTAALPSQNNHNPFHHHNEHHHHLQNSTFSPPPKSPTSDLGSIISTTALPGTTFTHPLLRNVRAVTDRHGHTSGTRMYLANALASLVLLVGFLSSSNANTPRMSFLYAPGHLSMSIGFLCLMLDNTINAIGKYIGAGPTLRFLTKLRLVAHGTSIPLLFIPMIEALFSHQVISYVCKVSLMAFCTGIAVLECWDWSRLDLSTLKLVDNRASREHQHRYLAGTLTYTSGKVLKCVGPVILFTLLELGVGAWLWMYYRALAGRFLVSSGLTSLFSGSVGRPDIQMVGETVTMGLLWASLAAASGGVPAGPLLLPGYA